MTNEKNSCCDWTPEQKAFLDAHFRDHFTPEMLTEYVENDVERIPAVQVIAELEQMLQDDISDRKRAG